MGTNLTRIGEKARKDRKLVFTSLYHHISDIDNLRACYDDLPAKEGKRRGRSNQKRIRKAPRRQPSGSIRAAEANGLPPRTEATQLYTEAGRRHSRTTWSCCAVITTSSDRIGR